MSRTVRAIRGRGREENTFDRVMLDKRNEEEQD